MKDNDEFLKKMENLKVPEINPGVHPKMVKMAIMNAERSAALGLWLIVLPCYYFLTILVFYYFNAGKGLWFLNLPDLLPGTGHYFAIIVFLILPIICIMINLLSITHVSYQKIDPVRNKVRELSITIKIKFWNILLILISLALILTLFVL